jgi:hypothetical protein
MDPIGGVVSFVGQVLDALRNTPGGFGLLVVPLGIFWIISISVSRRR